MKEKRAPIVTLCGSMQFLDDFLKAESTLTMEGYVVLGVSVNKQSDDNGISIMSEELREKFRKATLRKIEMSDEVFVINRNGYIGESTKEQLLYAQELGKTISFMYINCPETCKSFSDNCPVKKSHHSVTKFSQNEKCPKCIGYIE